MNKHHHLLMEFPETVWMLVSLVEPLPPCPLLRPRVAVGKETMDLVRKRKLSEVSPQIKLRVDTAIQSVMNDKALKNVSGCWIPWLDRYPPCTCASSFAR